MILLLLPNIWKKRRGKGGIDLFIPFSSPLHPDPTNPTMPFSLFPLYPVTRVVLCLFPSTHVCSPSSSTGNVLSPNQLAHSILFSPPFSPSLPHLPMPYSMPHLSNSDTTTPTFLLVYMGGAKLTLGRQEESFHGYKMWGGLLLPLLLLAHYPGFFTRWSP